MFFKFLGACLILFQPLALNGVLLLNNYIDKKHFISLGFSSVYVCNQQVADIVGVICCGLSEHDSNTFSQSSPTDKSCFIYRLKHKPDVLIVQCTTVISSEQAYSWVEQVNIFILVYNIKHFSLFIY